MTSTKKGLFISLVIGLAALIFAWKFFIVLYFVWPLAVSLIFLPLTIGLIKDQNKSKKTIGLLLLLSIVIAILLYCFDFKLFIDPWMGK
ncbi:MAG TPA: hypothetical protein VE973_01665 [Candidatus Limnocylindria bacterium]|nr:hypothetical protein [Candidatus Limnocylindria bacterium]